MNALSKVWTPWQLTEYNYQKGYCFFSKDTMRFFKSRLSPKFWHIKAGILFITSEKFDYKTPRRYTLRIMHESGNVSTLGEFQQYSSLYYARKAAHEYMRED